MLVERFGNEIVSRENNKLTKPVFFAAKQGNNIILSICDTPLHINMNFDRSLFIEPNYECH